MRLPPGSLVAQPCLAGRVREALETGALLLSGSRIELEGNHLPVTHSKDVTEALSG